jgi:hypothetical protein
MYSTSTALTSNWVVEALSTSKAGVPLEVVSIGVKTPPEYCPISTKLSVLTVLNPVPTTVNTSSAYRTNGATEVMVKSPDAPGLGDGSSFELQANTNTTAVNKTTMEFFISDITKRLREGISIQNLFQNDLTNGSK